MKWRSKEQGKRRRNRDQISRFMPQMETLESRHLLAADTTFATVFGEISSTEVADSPTDLELLSVSSNVLAAAAAPVAMAPQGSLIYESVNNDSIATAGEIDTFTIDLDAGQTLTVVAEAGIGLTPEIQLFDPSSVSLGTDTAAAPGEFAVLQSLPAASSGTYTVTVTGSGGTLGSYGLDLILNAAVEGESHSGATNNDFATAQDIDSSFIALPGGSGQRGAVTGNLNIGGSLAGPVDAVGTPLSFGFAEDGSFSGPSIGIKRGGVEFVNHGTVLAGYTVGYNGQTFTNQLPSSSSTSFPVSMVDHSVGSDHTFVISGNIQAGIGFERIVQWSDGDGFAHVTTTINNESGATLANLALLENVDPDPGGTYTTTNDVTLSGQLAVASGAAGAIGLGATDPGAVVSIEGFTVNDPFAIIGSPVDPESGSADEAINLAFDLGSLPSGSSVSRTFQIVLGDNQAAVESEFAAIGAPPTFSPSGDVQDWYRFTLADGESASATLTNLSGSLGTLDLYASDGTTLLTQGISATSAALSINNFVDNTTDGSADTYYLRVEGATSNYSLVVTRQIDFDTEVNDGIDTGQALGTSGTALGFVRAGAAFVADGVADLPPVEPPVDATREHEASRLIVGLSGESNAGLQVARMASMSATIVKTFSTINAAVVELGTAYEDIDDAISAFESQSWVRYAEPDYVLHTTETIPDDPQFSSLWGMHNTGQTGGTIDADIDAPEAWDRFTGSSTVVIASIDTGVDYNHVDLAANMWVNPGEIAGDGIDNDGNGFIDDIHGIDTLNSDSDPYDDNRHGTHTSGTFGGDGNNGIGVAGVNWDVQIMALKFLGAGGSGSTSDAVEAIEYMTMMKRDYGINIVASNNSWGGGSYSTALIDAIQASNDEGIMFVASAGNSSRNTDSSPSYPASYNLDGIISVAATDHNDAKASFSNYGAVSVDLGAPGVNTLSTTPGNTYTSLDGTSMAAPHVAGAVAMLSAANPSASLAEIKDAILTSSDPVPALAGITVSGGRLNLYNALETIRDAGDYYQFEVNSGDLLTLETFTPANGPGEPVNILDPYVELYDESGTLVGSDDNNAADGRNALLNYTAGTTGIYTARVLGTSDTAGEYVLSVGGATGGLSPFGVSDSDLADGASLVTAPTQLTLTFNDPLLLPTLTAADLQVNATPATGVQVVNSQTVTFDLPVGAIVDGHNVATLGAGVVTDIQNTPNTALALNFTIDVTGSRIIGSSIIEGETLPTSNFTYTATFDEEIDATNLGPEDVLLTGLVNGSFEASSVSFDAPSRTLTVEFGDLPEDSYTLTLISGDGAFEDLVGNDLDGEAHPFTTVPTGDGVAGGNFVVNFATDIVTNNYPTPLEPLAPLGSLIYDPVAVGVISVPSDVDSFTVNVDDGQTLTVVLTGENGLAPEVELFDPANASRGTATASVDGEAILQAVPTTGAGLYTMTVRGDGTTTGSYSLRLILNAALEDESHGGATNNSLASAQDLDPTFIGLGFGTAQRGAVLGTSDGFPETEDPVLTSNADLLYNSLTGEVIIDATESPGGIFRGYLFDTSNAFLNENFTPFMIGGIDVNSPTQIGEMDWGAGIETSGQHSLGNILPSGLSLAGLQSFFSGAVYVGIAGSGTHTFDLIPIFVGPPSNVDYYSFTLGAGQSATLLLQETVSSDLELKLLDGSGTLLASGTETDNLASINDFVATTSGTYYAQVTGSVTDYNLVVTRDASFDDGRVYRSLEDAQDIHVTGTVLGHRNRGSASGTLQMGLIEDSLPWGRGSNTTIATELGYAVTKIPSNNLSSVDLSTYDVLVLAGDQSSTTYSNVVANLASIDAFVSQGGVYVINYAAGSVSRPIAYDVLPGADGVSFVGSTGADINVVDASSDLITGPGGTIDDTNLDGGNSSTHGYTSTLHEGANAILSTGASNHVVAFDYAFDAGQVIVHTIPVEWYEGGPHGIGAIFHRNLFNFAAESASDPGGLYRIEANVGDVLNIATRIPGAGPGEFVNDIDIAVELFDPAGTLVASDSSGSLSHTALAAGAYTVRVFSENGIAGEYVLEVSGYTGEALPFAVVATDPIDGEAFLNPPTEIIVDFSDPFLLTSLAAADLTVNGTPATAMTILDVDTVAFTLPVGLGDGVHDVAIAGGAIVDLQNQPLTAFSSQFTIDATGPRVISTSILEGDSLATGSLTYTATFDEELDASNLGIEDVLLTGQLSGAYVPNSLNYDAPSSTLTVEFGELPEDNFTLTLLSGNGAFEDVVGNNLDGEVKAGTTVPSGDGVPGADFVVHFVTDVVTSAYPTPLEPIAPLGSLVYDPAVTGVINVIADVDNFTIDVDDGQTITLLLAGQDGLAPEVELFDPSGVSQGVASAAANGEATLQVVPTGAAGQYTVTVRGVGESTGSYTLQLILNAALEDESHGGAKNNTLGAAQDLDPTFIGLGFGTAQRGAVLGTSDGYRNYQASQTISDTLHSPNVLNFDFTSETEAIGDGVLTITAQGDLSSSSENLTIDVEGLFSQTVFASGGLDGSPVTATVDLSLADLTMLTADGTISIAVTPSSSVGNASGNYITLDLTYPDSPASSDYYSFSLNAGQSATLLLEEAVSSSLDFALLNSLGTVLSEGSTDAPNVDHVIHDFVAATTGTYYARVSGVIADYNLVVTRDASFATEGTNPVLVGGESALAQDITTTGTVLGHLSVGSPAGVDPGAVPVSLGQNLYDGDGFLWDIRSDGSISNGTSDAYDGGLDLSGFPGFATGSAEQDGREIAIGPATIGSVEVMRKIYVPDDQGFARYLEIVTNVSPEPVVYSVNLHTNLGSGSATQSIGTSSGDTLFDVNDDWLVTDDSNDGAGDPSMLHVVAGPGGQRPSSASLYSQDDIQVTYDLALASGETQVVMHFASQNANSAAALAKAPTLANLGIDALAGMSATEIGQVVNFDAASFNHFSVEANAGDALNVSTLVPSAGPGEFVNSLDIAVELYDPAGTLVASDSSGALSHTALATGSYTVRVLSENEIGGEFVLNVSGHTGPFLPFTVMATDPADGDIFLSAPTEIVVDFSDSFLSTSLEASDLTVDGIAATDMTILDADSVKFTLPTGLSDGVHNVAIAAGAITGLQNQPLTAHTSQFSIDTTGPRVISTSIQEGDTIPTGALVYTVQFDEELDPTNLDAADVQLVGQITGSQTPDVFTYNAASSTLTLEYANLADDLYTLTLSSGDGAFEDLIGNDLDGEPLARPLPPNVSGDGAPGGDFVVSFTADLITSSFAVPLDLVQPSGSLVYEGGVEGAIQPVADTDSYTIELDDNQQVTVVLSPNASLQGAVELRGPGGAVLASQSATVAGEEIVLPVVGTAGAGTYTIVVGSADIPALYGDTDGDFDVDNMDLLIAFANFTGPLGSGKTLSQGDINLDGDVDNDDLMGMFSSFTGPGGPFAPNTLLPLSTGTYSARIILNAAVEEEAHGRATNDSLATAQDLDPIFFNLGFGGAERGAVLGVADGVGLFAESQTISDTFHTPNVLTFDFASLAPVYGDGTLTVTAKGDLNSSSENVVVDLEGVITETLFVSGGSSSAPNIATIDLSLANLTTLIADGTITTTVTPSSSVGNASGNYVTLDLTYPSTPPTSDYYSFSLNAGQSATLSTTGQTGENFLLELLDASGTVLASGTTEQVISEFVAATTGTYYARVRGAIADYNLVVTRDASFATEGTNPVLVGGESALAQDITTTGTVLGSLSADRSAGVDPGAVPVSLGQNLYDADGFLWDIRSDGSISNGTSDAYDGGLDLSGFPSFATGSAEQDGREIAIGPATIGSVEVIRKIYVPDDQGFARFLEIVTNTSAVPVNHTLNINTNLGSDSGTQLIGTSSGDTLFDVNDDWLVTDDSNDGGRDPSMLHVVAGPGGQRPSSASQSSDSIRLAYDLTLAPGETKVVMHFASQNANRAAALAKAPTLASLGIDALAGMSATEIGQVVNFSSSGFNYFSVEANAGDALNVSTLVPAAGPGEFVNDLDIAVELYNPAGALVGSDSSGALSHTALATGSYTVRVLSENEIGGEYVLNVTGHTGSPLPSAMVATSPLDGSISLHSLTEIVVNFSDPILLTSLEASDLTVDGIAATDMTILDADSVKFTLPASLSDGVHNVAIADGAITGLQSQPLTALASQFSIDTTGPQIISTSIQEGAAISTGTLVYTLQFDKELDTTNLDAADVQLVGETTGSQTPASFTYEPTKSILTLEYADLEDDYYTLTLFSGEDAFEDVAGNALDGERLASPPSPNFSGDNVAGGDFVISFNANVGPTLPLSLLTPAELQSQDLNGTNDDLVFETQTSSNSLTSTGRDLLTGQPFRSPFSTILPRQGRDLPLLGQRDGWRDRLDRLYESDQHEDSRIVAYSLSDSAHEVLEEHQRLEPHLTIDTRDAYFSDTVSDKDADDSDDSPRDDLVELLFDHRIR